MLDRARPADLVSVGDFRARASEWLSKVCHTGNRAIITRHGKPVAALVSMRDLVALEEAEGVSEARKTRDQEANWARYMAIRNAQRRGD